MSESNHQSDETERYFHAAREHHGETFAFDRGGHYERIENGIVQQRIIAGNFCGFEISPIEELAASKSPEAAVFAQVKNLSVASGNTTTQPIMIPVYELHREPDVDISNSHGDFSMIEEVRYRDLTENPAHGELAHTVTLPGHVAGDVDLAYLPEGPHIIREWADAVKTCIQDVITGGTYPDDVSTALNIESPDLDAYL